MSSSAYPHLKLIEESGRTYGGDICTGSGDEHLFVDESCSSRGDK